MGRMGGCDSELADMVNKTIIFEVSTEYLP